MKNRKREIRTSGSVRDEDGQHPHLLGRRKFLSLTAGAAAAATLPRVGFAQSYPARPVRIIVGQAAGSSSDITARLVGQFASERLGQQFIVEVRPGAAGDIATEAVAAAPADGYTILLVNAQNTINAALYEKLNFSLLRDIAPVAGIVRGPLVMEVTPSFAIKTVPEFIAFAKANPGKINFASSGNGTPQHVSGELFRMMTGVDIIHVPYRGSAPALTDLIAGQVQVMFDTATASIDQIRSGRLRALAVTTTMRSEALPAIPTIGEFVPGYEASWWVGVGAPKNMPVEIRDKLNKEINAALGDPQMKARFADLGGTVLPGSPADFGHFVADEIEKWGKVVRFAGIKAD